jgi:predicted short-subunit dehydrogenase-like oxidoreductase (DUF2520 family)
MNKLVVIGWGNVAQNLAYAIQSTGFEIIQVLTLSSTTPFSTIQNAQDVIQNADLYLISVPDDQLEDVIERLPDIQGLVVHTSGVKSSEILAKFKRYGAFYPLQTFRSEVLTSLVDVPFLLECSQESDLNFLINLASTLKGIPMLIQSETKRKIHLAAVFAMNFSNAMYQISEEILEQEKLSFKIFQPLLLQAQKNAFDLGALKAQTGPAIRGDQKTMDAHLEEINQESWKEIYQLISQLIKNNKQ